MLKIIPCRHATLLIEQRTELTLAPTDRRSLWLHLRYCTHCRRYAEQSVLIAELARTPASLPALPADTRQRLRQRLREAGL